MMRGLIVSIVLLVIAAGIITFQRKTITRLATERAQAIKFATLDSARAVEYQNQYGHQVKRTEEVELSLRNARDLSNTERLAFLKELEGVKSNLRNLESAVRLQSMVTADLKLHLRDTTIILTPGDTIHAHKFQYLDQYNSLRGITEGDTTMLVKARISVPLDGAMFWERNKILGLRIGRKKWYAEFTSPNPWVKIDASEYIKIEKR